MSLKYGLNGNDLDWEYVEFLENICLDCLHAQIEAGYYEMTSSEQEQYNEEHEMDCDGHEHVYFEAFTIHGFDGAVETTSYNLFVDEYTKAIKEKRQADLSPFLDWWFVHDTNTNFVRAFGNIPNQYFDKEYLLEVKEAGENK